MTTRRPSAPANVREIARRLATAGHDTWAVGGAVRDVLMGRPSGDWDLATSARPEEVRKIFRRTVPLGMEHGTVGVLADDGTMYEVTTFRRDVETDGRHAVVAFADTIEEDLSRRDFTVNAIAWHPLRQELLDPFGGCEDLTARRLRTVGEPEERFREDYLRVLRALRFAGLFGFEIEDATWQALRRLVDNLRRLSAERIRDELLKVLDADPAPARALDLYARSGALAALYPELEALRGRPPRRGRGPSQRTGNGAVQPPDAWTLTVATMAEIPRGRPFLRLAALARELDPADAAAMLLRLRFSNAQIDEAAWRARAPELPAPDSDDAAFRRWLSASGAPRLAALGRLELARSRAERRLGMDDRLDRVVTSWRRAKAVRAARPPLELGDLAIDGRRLIQLGLQPGPRFRRILEALLDWVLEDPGRNQPDLLDERALELARTEASDE